MKCVQNRFKIFILLFIICYLLCIYSIIIDSVLLFTIAFIGVGVFYYNTITVKNEF